MKHKISELLLISLLLFNLPACIEVKDQDDDADAFVQTFQGGDLIVEEPLYLIGGEFLRESEMLNYENSQSPTNEVQAFDYSFSSIDIGPKGILYTMGNNVRIRVQNFKSRAGMIATFPDGQRSSQGDGRSGGAVNLWAQSAEGNLKVLMRGEDGRQGLPGNPPNETMKGRTGDKGLEGAMIGTRTVRVASSGGRGGQGKKGFRGKVGFNGGNSGTFEFTVAQDNPLYLSLEMFAGNGGPGGVGGAGGAGGDGGLGGVIGGGARKASGPAGPVGDQGDVGPSGNSGLLETACVSIAGIMECKKESFSYSK